MVAGRGEDIRFLGGSRRVEPAGGVRNVLGVVRAGRLARTMALRPRKSSGAGRRYTSGLVDVQFRNQQVEGWWG